MVEIDLEGHVAIITGSGRGLGRAIAQRLSDAGAFLVLNDLDEEPLRATAAQLEGRTAGLEVVAADIGQAVSSDALVTRAQEAFGRVDIVVNCAGMWRDAFISEMSDEQWDSVLRVNLSGSFYLTRAAAPYLRDGGGSVVNFTSQSGLAGNIGQVNYSAAKAGIIGLTKASAKEFARYGVRVNAVSPAASGTRAIESIPDSIRDAFTKQIPMGRFGEPEEIADVVLVLASPLSRYVTGQVLPVDGGFSIGKP